MSGATLQRQALPDTEVSGMPDVTDRPVIAACSFCLKPSTEVGTLVAGPGVYICDACVALCAMVINGKAAAVPQLALWEQVASAEEALATLPRVAAAAAGVERNLTGRQRCQPERGA